MVKVVKGMSVGPEIVTIRDLIPAGNPAGGAGPAAVSPAAGIESAVNNLDKYISLADRGITLLGRLDSIVGKVQARRAAPEQPPQIPVHRECEHLEYVHGAEAVPARASTRPDTPGPEIPNPAPTPAAGPITLGQIIQVLDMLDKMQPGITVRQLHEAITKQPEAVAHIIAVYTGQKL